MAIDKLLTRVTTGSPRVKYRRVNLYVRTSLALAHRKLAVREGFRVGDLARMLVMAGMVVRLLTLNEERVRKFFLLSAWGYGAKRPYAYGRDPHRNHVWISVWLPDGVLTFIDSYARSRGATRNDALNSFFQLGLQAYLRGRKKFLDALTNAAKAPGASGASHAPRSKLDSEAGDVT